MSYYSQVNSLGPKIWYRFDETSGTPTNSGSLSTTTTFYNFLLNEPTNVDGRSVALNGTTSYAQLPSHASFSLFNDRSFTVECWVKIANADTSGTADHTIFRLNPASSPHKVIDFKIHGNYNNNRGKAAVGSVWITEILSSPIDNGQWHHVVYTFNTSSVKLYVDGSLAASTTPSNLDASFVYDTSTKKLIGAGYLGTAQTTIGAYFKGGIDEFAIYDYELSGQQILDNFNAGASVAFADAPGTASSLMVQPSLTTDGIHSAAPATASSASGDHYVSNFNLVKHVDTYLSELSLEQWYKFDKLEKITNYGNGGTVSETAWAFNGNTTTLPQGGIQGSGALQMQGAQGHQVQLAFGVTEPVSTEITDHEFTFGFWFKGEAGFKDKSVDVIRYYNPFGSGTYYLRVRAGTGYVEFGRIGSQTHTAVFNTDVTDGNWHFIQAKGSNSNTYIKVNVDNGTEVSTTTSGTAPTGISSAAFNLATITGTNTAKAWISHYFVAPIANVGSTEVTNLLSYDDLVVQATAMFPEPLVRFENKFNDEIQSYNPKMEFRLDESDGSPINFGTIDTISIAKTGTAVTYLQPTQNRFAYKFTNANTYFQGDWTAATGTFTTNAEQTMSIVFKSNGYTTWDQILGSTGMFGFLGTGITIRILANNGHLQARLNRGFGPTDTENITFTTDVADNKWHHVVAVKDGSNFSLYLDGSRKARITNSAITPADSGTWAINGEGKYDGTSGTKELYIDEFALLAAGLSDQEVLELFQSLNIFDGAMIANNATLPMPTNIAGTGATYNSGSLDASALFAVAEGSAEVVLTADAMTSSSTFVHPNYVAGQIVDVNYGAQSAIADALFHDPQYNIGEEHLAASMDASALMVHPAAIAAGSIAVSTAVGGPAEFVMPGIVTIKGAQHFAEPMRSNAIFPLPPAYIQLTDDDWFVRLLEGHADKKAEFIQGTILAGSASTDIIKGGFLSFFDDILADITQNTNPNYIASEIPNHYFDPVGYQVYDQNGNLLPLDTSKNVARVTPSRGVLNPTPMVSKGYFDNQERKAVRIENIEIPLPGTSSSFSIRPYNIEFSFKTTKANQVIAYGQYTSPQQTNSRKVGAIGLYNGRIYLAEDFYTPVSAFGETGLRSLRVAGTVPHPINFTDATYVGYMLGNKNIADGQWHHVVIQKGYTDGRTQIWIDGKLDKQLGVQSNDGRSTGYASIPGSDASQEVRPYIVGFNSADTNLSSDFQTSAWNFYPGRFLEERDISLNYTAYGKWKPIKAEPMTATAKATDNNKAAGNRSRALMLYWWPVTRELGPSESLVSNDRGQFGPDDVPTFDSNLYTYDYIDEKPQTYYGWDIFPISITGYKGMLGGDPSEFLKSGVLQSGGYYIDPVTSAPRYLDVVNDIDLSSFDAIFFRNFPDQSEELDAYIREQFSDEYFNVKERDLYNDFIASLRAAVDTGISLFVTNSQLAIDLGIIDKYDKVPDFYEGTSDDYAPTILPATASNLTNGDWIDVHRNNRLRVVNTVEGLTDESGYIWKDWAYFEGGIAGEAFSGEPDRPFVALENRPNGLQVGDTFVISDATILGSYFYAVPFANVKAGKIVTAFANTIRQGTAEVENPYKNYATSIAVEPGTILNGKALGGKIFVNFTERLTTTISPITGTQIVGMRPSSGARDEFSVDLIQDEWINLAYNEGEITLAKRDELLNASYNLDRRLAAEIAGQNRPQVIADIQKEKTWDGNGLNILVQRNTIDDPTGGRQRDGLGTGERSTQVIKTQKTVPAKPSTTITSLQWFSFDYSYQYPRIVIKAYSMLTRGFRWLSDKIVDEGTVNRVQVMNATVAEMPMPVVTADKDRTVYASSMLANARIVHAPGYALADVSNTTLPLTASASFGEYVKNIVPDVLTASALMKQPRISGVEEDEIVVYIMHVDPILYLREDIIK